MTRKFLIVTALVAGVATAAEAQICAGTAPFTAGHMRAGVGAEFPDGAKSYGGELAWGHQSGAYVGGSLSRMTIDNTEASALRFGGNAGYEMSFESMPKVRVCPTARLGYTNGPNEGTTTSSMLDMGVGAAVGSVLSASENVAIVPSLGLSWARASIKIEDPAIGELEASDSWFEARLAAGFVINRAITVAPVVTIPLNQEGAESTFGFAASYNFGRAGGVVQQGGKKKNNRKR